MQSTDTISYNDASRAPGKKRRWWLVLFIIIAILIIVRLILPAVILHYVNKTLGENKGYPGHVEDIDLAIIRGAYTIKGIRIEKADTITGKRDSIPMFTSPAIDLSVEWGALFQGRIVGEIAIAEPMVNFVKERHKGEDPKKDTTDFKKTIRDLMPLKINRLEITNGVVRYVDPATSPKVDVRLTDLQILATNLSNSGDGGKTLPADVQASAQVYGGGFDLHMKLDPLNKRPTFDMNAEIKAVDLTQLNDFFRAYGKFDVRKGAFGLYTEFAAKEGKFKGYVKPLIQGLEVGGLNEENASAGQKLWESVVGIVSEVLENQPRDQLATQVPVEGSFENPETGIWDAVIYVLRNAFVQALQPSINHTINIGNVEQVEEKQPFLKKLFGKNDKADNDQDANNNESKKEKGRK